mmetsp:Transcript_31367/g.70489  ORF Transcript_31367/g.70489 Transcript_31367/m.70489 type:complete len:93 (-) Transcript_31367:281-559(-)
MKFSAAAFLAICAVGSAFVPSTPARAIRSKARTTTNMVAVDALPVQETSEALNQVALTMASSGSDFGGLAGPIAGLGFIVGLIVFLSPPLAD